MNTNKHKLLGALFSEAAKLGIDQEMLRDTIAPAVIHKRLSKASVQEVARVVDHITGKSVTRHPSPVTRKRYESSRAGLIEEIKDLAIARYGEDFIRPLNALCERFRVEGYRSLRVNQAKAVKQTLIRLQKEDPRNTQPPESPFCKEDTAKSPLTKGGIGGCEGYVTFDKGTKGVINQLPGLGKGK